jgi:S1-C subfamily serine protease
MITSSVSAIPQEAPKLFEMVSRSVWIVTSSTSLGSAVAITPHHLLTNCHVVQNRPFVWVKQHEVREKALVVSGDGPTDRCVLEVPTSTLSPITAIRGYDDLKVGEAVYTIGAPRGLELTLGQGIISGLRQQRGRRLIQTTAQVSPGSSGGGLFDRAGNLIGITTFVLRDSDALNFAIAAEDYFR